MSITFGSLSCEDFFASFEILFLPCRIHLGNQPNTIPHRETPLPSCGVLRIERLQLIEESTLTFFAKKSVCINQQRFQQRKCLTKLLCSFHTLYLIGSCDQLVRLALDTFRLRHLSEKPRCGRRDRNIF